MRARYCAGNQVAMIECDAGKKLGLGDGRAMNPHEVSRSYRVRRPAPRRPMINGIQLIMMRAIQRRAADPIENEIARKLAEALDEEEDTPAPKPNCVADDGRPPCSWSAPRNPTLVRSR